MISEAMKRVMAAVFCGINVSLYGGAYRPVLDMKAGRGCRETEDI